MPTECKVITKGAGLLREGRIQTASRTGAINRAIEQHRNRIEELTHNRRLATTSSILVVSVEVIDLDPQIGDTVASLWGDAA